jgi:hypothetical protein
MKIPHNPHTALYPRLIGEAWLNLNESVRHAHLDGETTVKGYGRFKIRHGKSGLARLLLWLSPLPPAIAAVDTQLLMTQDGRGERWERTFGDKLLVTKQWAGVDGRLIEQMGLLEFRFRLEIIDDGLTYRQERAKLRFGLLRIPLPRWLSPQVSANERPTDMPNLTHVRVVVKFPLAGFLISYEGDIQCAANALDGFGNPSKKSGFGNPD